MNEAEEKRVYRQQKRLETQRNLRLNTFISEVMKLAEGREFFYYLLELGKVGRNSFTGNALTTAFHCGEQNVGLQIQSRLIEVSPKGYLQMLTEKAEEELNVRRTESADDDDGNGDY